MASAWEACCSNIPQRWIVVIMSFLGLFNAYAMRVCLSIAITEMVVPTNNTEEFVDDTCPDNNDKSDIIEFNNKTVVNTELFEWSEYTQGIILSSFYWGYILTNLPGGLIAEKFGGKHTLGLGILSTAIFTISTPFCVMYGDSTTLVFLRILMGIGEGPTYPALSVLIAQWIPEHERSKAGAVAFSGAPLGTIFGMLASGLILRNGSWPTVFYFFGVVGFLQFLLNSAFCYSKPSDHPFIGKSEAKYLKEQLKNTHANLPPTPWRHILRSKPVWALVVATIGNAWGFLTICSDMPKYMSSVLKFSVQSNGYFSSVPYLCMWINSCVSSAIADYLITSRRVSISNMRKIGSTISSLGPGIFIVAASYAGCNGFLVVLLLTIGMTFMGCATFAILVNMLDLGPNYAGTLMGIVNGISTLSGIASPYVVGLITPNQTISEWRAVFWIVFGMFFVSNAIFVLYGSGELQEWNDPAFLAREKMKSKDDEKEGIQLMPMKA
ncbi:putative inorganic phosphate cotransporter [Nasonia vitripennis]|uniref:Major facilitator superfamily (MFS) profile domain-containing protein n=1 Tax=Nasonia vitripennis TaxID=7425 RepID=A0A7M7LL87_NASVI|nr:putative inorganic phosphate cotransporter [Nasonia vitripennis]